MRIKSLRYAEWEGTAQEWVIEGLTLGAKTLIVGKNASGKTRTLNVINALSRSLLGTHAAGSSGSYDCEFVDGTDIYRYVLKSREMAFVQEELSINGESKLLRGDEGKGTIFAQKIDGGKTVEFQTPPAQLAAVARRDTIQHSFLEPLHEWASAVRHYEFGSKLGKDAFGIIVPGGPLANDRDPNAVVGIFRQAAKEFGDPFTQSVIRDLAEVDYVVTEAGVQTPVSIKITGAPGEFVGLYVKEKDLPGITDQHSMSQGMFRVLSLITQINYFQFKKNATCILIDDIGEGLDFDRSCRLIDLLRRKATENDVQIVLTTNDRFIMNKVPLEEWSVLQRKGNHIFVRNYDNSRAIFEEFKFTGLSNFSFLEMDVVNEQPAEKA